jgi:hypothetical protein
MDNLHIIFSEIFDIYPDDKFINKYIVEGNIDIDSLFKSNFLKLNVSFVTIWNFIYSTYPTKKDFIEFLFTNGLTSDFGSQSSVVDIDNKVFEKIINSIFHLKIGLLTHIDTNELNKKIQKCSTDMKDNNYIKSLIFDKIAFRYNVQNYDLSINPIVTIMQILKSSKNIDRINDNKYNPVSKSINEFINFSNDDLLYLNNLEKLQYIIYKDNHFILKLIDTISIIIDCDNIDDDRIRSIITSYQKVHNKHVLLFHTSETTYNQVSGWYDDMYNFQITKDVLNILPNLCKYNVTISDLMYPNVKSLSKINNSIYYLIGNKNNKEHYVYTNQYDKYILNDINMADKLKVKLERYIILDPNHFTVNNNGLSSSLKQIIRSIDMYDDMWNLHIKHSCPVRTGDPRNGILLYCNFIYFYFLKNEKKIEQLQSIYNVNSKYCVFIVDNRPNILSIISVLFTMINLNSDWCCRFYTSTSALPYYEKYIGNFVDVVDIDILNHKFHIDIYNKLLTSLYFWESLEDYEKCVIIQDDGILLRKGIDRFLEYDYCGSPWADCAGNEYLKSNVNVDLCGNGGYSLRTVSKMKDVVQNTTDEEKNILFYNNLNKTPEDVYFVKNLKKMNGVRMPSSRDASFFGSEEILNMDSLGIHKFWCYIPSENVKAYFKKILEE